MSALDANHALFFSLTQVRELFRRLSPCRICPRDCGADRRSDRRGRCGAGRQPEIASAIVHRGEEPPISGTRGSGTIFFNHCPLRCRHCQNWPISQQGIGRQITIDDLAAKMLRLQQRGVHNINLVNPTQYWPQIAAAVRLARARGLHIPILANTSGYERLDTLSLLRETVQIWLPDIKYASSEKASKISQADDLPEVSWAAVGWMVQTAGPLRYDAQGLAVGGVVIRHLALPGSMGETEAVLRGIKQRFGVAVPVSLMTQYFPAHRALGAGAMGRCLTRREKQAAHRLLEELGLQGWRQDDE